MKLATLGSRLPQLDPRTAKPPEKMADALYTSPAYRIWRAQVITKAQGRCEAIESGRRCTKAAPRHRMFADHKVEVKDGGAKFDPMNGQCLCGQHHSAKTARARALRR